MNISYYDGKYVHYLKAERVLQEKHFSTADFNLCYVLVKKHFGIDINSVDYIAIDFEGRFAQENGIPDDMAKDYRDNYEGKTLAFEIKGKLKQKLGLFPPTFFVSHHYAHSLSGWMMEKKSNVSIIIDGVGDGRAWSVFNRKGLKAKGPVENGSIGLNMMYASRHLGVTAHDPNDLAGKVMGIQAYGKLDLDYLESLRAYGMNDIDKVFSYNNKEPLDWIRTVHERTGEILVDFFKKHVKPKDKVFYAGGVAQNIVWNTELRKHFDLIIPPHCGDEGCSLGGIEYLRRKTQTMYFKIFDFPYSQTDVEPELPSQNTIKEAARLLADKKIVGWYQGNGEVGPRALGNRSIFMSPLLTKEDINRVKGRESYRPFGASVLEEVASDYFILDGKDEYMLYMGKVREECNFPCITHVDGSCRVQTVYKKNMYLRQLLEAFREYTGYPILLNTSLNMAGKPIAGSPEHINELELDAVFVGDRRVK